MPKEFIKAETDSDGRVEIGWGRERYVEIGTVLSSKPQGENGWYVDLDRAAINRLIRLLRKARDQAYGADA